MRISTNTIYQRGMTAISELQGDQSRLQQQIATGKRILVASDDPIAASRALEVSQAQSVNAMYANNRKIANSNLTSLDVSLGGITDLLQNAQTTLVGAAGTLSSQQRNTVAIQLTAQLESLIGMANAKDGAGNYLYAGYQNKTQPFTATSSGATYNGDSNQQLLQVDAHRQLAVNASGDSVFMAGGNDVFAAFSDVIALLKNPTATSSAVEAGVATAISKVKTATDTVSNVWSSVGTRLNEIDALNDVSGSREVEYAKALSELQDLDYAQAVSELTQKQTILEAAQKSFVKITGLTLFDFIR